MPSLAPSTELGQRPLDEMRKLWIMEALHNNEGISAGSGPNGISRQTLLQQIKSSEKKMVK